MTGAAERAAAAGSSPGAAPREDDPAPDAQATEAPGGPATATEPATPSRPDMTPAADGAPQPPPRVVVPRWVQLVLLPIALLALWALARAAGKVLVIFIVAAVIALILNPAVAFLQRSRIPRGLAVLAVYLAFFTTLAGIAFLLANPISNQVDRFTRDLPHITREANKRIASLQRNLDKHGLHVHLVKQGKTALQSIEEKVSKSAGKLVSFGGALLTEVASALFDLVLVFVLSVYMLLYGNRIGALVRRLMPDGDGTPGDDYPTLVQRAVSRCVGGQLLFSVIMGASAGLSLYLFGVLGIFPDGSRFAVGFGVFYGVMELIPYVGPIATVGLLFVLNPALVIAIDMIVAVWLVLLFIGLQQVEGHVVAPQVFGHTLRINPLLVIFALLLGLQLYGIIGALVALPIVAVLRETAVYLSRHISFESWDGPRGLL